MDPASIIRQSGRIYAKNIAVSFQQREQTYAELYHRAILLANVLRHSGAGKGDPVAVLADNAFETVEQAAACALANNPRATLYTYHAPSVNRYLLELTGARVLLVQAKYYRALAPLLTDLKSLKTVIVFDGEAPAGTVCYEDALASASAEDKIVPVTDDDVHIIRFSSGTTGKPKGVYHSVGRWTAYNSEWRWGTPMIDETSRYLVPCSLAHLGIAFLWGFLTVGGRIIPMPAFDARHTLELLEREKITHAAAAPVMIREMVADDTARSRDFSALKCLMYAGSPIATNTLREAIRVFGPTLYQLYAQSEAMPITMLLPHHHRVDGTEAELRRLRSAGRPTGNNFVTIRDENGNLLPPDAIGEIACLGPGTMSGLWNDPEGKAVRTLPDGSILTRDMGFMDEDGFVYLVDRKDDMIVSGGYNIWPSELEEALTNHPAVAEVSVFGVPDEKWGETPRAVVVLKKGAKASKEELISYTREVVGPVKKVTSVDFVAALPRTATGKVLRGELKAPFWKDRATRISGS
ncbi:AMP-binding protein [Bradyrhizobium sp. 1]|uniref:class I adenylate-forming enzyme family protein n=1 Tax=Bradyrhizobium sp. 1 TaxID=241591 RepID=UPI001FFAAE16|nr:AMP-binding protein [Bradyrhizobium sp. 1]MCK1395742.1 AMP-binding protein [Bradyrhizobium sp. 1]